MWQFFGRFSLSKFKPRLEVGRETRRLEREHFIPARPAELTQQLLHSATLTAEETGDFRSLCHQLENYFHDDIRQQLRELRDRYDVVNPDRDTERFHPIAEVDRENAVTDLFAGLSELLQRANFQQLTQAEIEAAIGQASQLGVRLNVDLAAFERLAVYARGQTAVRHRQRSWRYPFKVIETEIPMYQRLVVTFSLAAAAEGEPFRAAYLRFFKNVPQQDVDMTLPGAKVQISLVDQGKILLPTLSGIGITGLKIFKGVLLLAFASFYGLLAAIGLIGAAIGSGVKALNGYVRTKNKYELNLARNLYYQNLDNNAGVLLRLAEEAEAQETREVMLAYFVLLTAPTPSSERDLDAKAEGLLRDLGLDVDFESDDALQKLHRLGLCQEAEPGQLRAVPLKHAIHNVTLATQAKAVQ